MPQEEFLTQEKYNEFKEELENLKTTRRKEVAEQLEYAKSLGDLSENAEYHEARDTQASVEDRIARIEHLLKHATIVSSRGSSVVVVGSVITIRRVKDREESTFTVVGTEEADMGVGKISMKSPLGSAALGKKKGETFSFATPGGKITCEIIAIK
ncbi:MAG: transcription elongation factor GreA [Candidatus Zambryskibacteria bacterium RIFCSPHIGHO2_01_FULL_43_25]|uniref:Transcription elongation factor GreA n=1 Tax=Candidatus Zambryskibacteria bacterium RIFCSPLOWO2_01_FULL_45_21 TaxID=1802761 RepID=A0A1G2U339_9BACT|nr:MAG: transcription elongation factor GreA [Candidatus Zambryskibacteria bacterium RIFCSPHIGHO2_01_FULL_43_25]OHB01019.1 MAG: transcription elongation factor GreA [Candidatus Zambryskibacteria bacterium RIFCSPHIGHO2_12_FULL_44_12b]OHB03936.1 MAG: transcription elongation factor GreA [Candidatus Zambryskibacteria bacterium RIFCSPLOWO2_01_FULL_45_21]